MCSSCPGSITRETIQEALKEEFRVDYAIGEERISASPGDLLEHYRPRIPVYLFRKQDNIRRYVADKGTRVLIMRDTF